VRRPARLVLAAGLLAGLALPDALPAALSARAAASTAGAGTAGTAGAAGAGAAGAGTAVRGARTPVSVVITSVSPAYARPGQKVTVRGLLTNASSRPLGGLKVQLRSASTGFPDRAALQQYAGGRDPDADSPQRRAVAKIRGVLPPGATRQWTAVLPVNEVHLKTFGVYPLAAQAMGRAGAPLGIGRTFLPFWPTAKHAVRPQREDIAWIWPLIDTPDQGPCPGLLNNRLAASVASGGRLAGLLRAGSSAAGQAARLTWAIDPALLTSAQTMTTAYAVGANLNCRRATAHKASAPAAAWLSGLRSAVSGQPAFVTPYADVDIAALTRANLDGDVHRALDDGRSVAAKILKRSFAPAAAASAGPQTPAGLTSATAWPADGLANYAMLENLAGVDGIATVVLSTAAMPPAVPRQYTPSAVTGTPDGEEGDMRVLLADATLTRILGSPAGRSDAPGARFAVQQRFLAETAMIATQAPGLPRAVVVAPPRHWTPSAGLASSLLADTINAPWLAPVSAGALAADTHAPGQVARRRPQNVGSRLLRRPLLHKVQAADRGAQLAQSIPAHPGPQLYRAIAGIESSAWRGTAARQRHAQSILRRVTDYVSRQVDGVSIIAPGRVTLGGQKGDIPIPIDNRLRYPARVKVQLSINQASDGGFAVLSKPGFVQIRSNVVTTRVIQVEPGITTQKLKVRAAAIGSTTISLRLLAPNGEALPALPVTMIVQATHFGTLALTVLAAALGVFVITSAGRAIRRGRTPPGPAPEGPGEQNAPGATDAGGHEQPEVTDTVGHDRAESGEAGTDHVLTEDADDYAPVPGWADRS
jgi:hypothetical protein